MNDIQRNFDGDIHLALDFAIGNQITAPTTRELLEWAKREIRELEGEIAELESALADSIESDLDDAWHSGYHQGYNDGYEEYAPHG